jgi:hypothetical protein
LQNYKPPLRISAKPETIVARYLTCFSLICLGFVFFAFSQRAFPQKPLAAVLLLLWYFTSRYYWLLYYRLEHKYSIIALRFDNSNGKDRLFFLSFNQTEQRVKLINKLHTGSLLVLYAIPIKAAENSSELESLVSSYSWLAIKRRITSRINQAFFAKRLIFVTTENSLGKMQYRALLRRVYGLVGV